MKDDHVTKTIATYNSLANMYAKKFEKYPPIVECDAFLSTLPIHAKILEAGCGSGRDSGYFCSKGYDVIGIDLSSKLLAIAKKAVPKATFALMDLRNIKFPDESFDGIWSCASLLHLKRKEMIRVLKKFYSLLKSNGLLFVLMKEGLGEKEDVSDTSPHNLRFFTYVTQRELTKLLETAGFTVEKMYTWNQKDRWPERSSKIWIASFSRKK